MQSELNTSADLKDVIKRLSKLFNDNKIRHRIVGSATLLILDLIDRPIHDIDVEVVLDTDEKRKLIESWKSLSPEDQIIFYTEEKNRNKQCCFRFDNILINVFDVYKEELKYKSFFTELNSIIIDGCFFNRPLDVIKKKQEYNRPKDIKDIQSIINNILNPDNLLKFKNK